MTSIGNRNLRRPNRCRFSLVKLLMLVVFVLYTPWLILMSVAFYNLHKNSNADADTTESLTNEILNDAVKLGAILNAAVEVGGLPSSSSSRDDDLSKKDESELFISKVNQQQMPIVSPMKNSGNAAKKVVTTSVKKKGGTTTTTDDKDTKPRTRLSGFTFDKKFAEQQTKMIQSSSSSSKNGNIYFKPLMAYIEKPMNDSIPGTGRHGEPEMKRGADEGQPPDFIVPLPRRLNSPSSLQPFQYDQLQSCHDLPHKFPIDRGLGNFIKPNVGNEQPIVDPLVEAPFCPVDADPFLPWIHDVFPSVDGSAIHFIAQNKRRCNSGKKFLNELDRLQPQTALMQGVSVKRIDEKEAVDLAPDLWSPQNHESEVVEGLPRYKLAPFEESDEDGQLTRFLCRFHTTEYEHGHKRTVVLGETLSTYPFNYELVNKRKSQITMITPRGKDNGKFWLSTLRFDCPVPNNGELRNIVRSGDGVLSDGTATIYVDIVPIRTSARFGTGEIYGTVDMFGNDVTYGAANDGWNAGGFDPKQRWGDKHVLPLVEASGRWSNIPICKPPPSPPSKTEAKTSEIESGKEERKNDVAIGGNGDGVSNAKKHTIAACLWASASFSTRGNTRTVTDTGARLIEWIEFHLLAGFDHFYVYDNTGAHTNKTSLESILYPRFDKSEVTRIEWPSRVCNNNIPAHENTGERSSQYASECSCRQRYGQYTDWLAAFDTDEYLIPMGNYTSMKDVLLDAEKKGTNILDFRSTRAYPLHEFTEPYSDERECGSSNNPLCRVKRSDALFLETYNCDFVPTPKPSWADRARKQIYRPEYVLQHYVHYSTITKGFARTYKEAKEGGFKWMPRYQDTEPIERVTDEINEAVMVHTKTLVPGDSVQWQERCKKDFEESHNKRCRIGFAHPNNKVVEGAANADDFKYNCFTNEKLTNYWLPRLHDAMKKREARLG